MHQETKFTDGGHYSLVNNVLGDIIHRRIVSEGHYSPVNNARGTYLGGGTPHYDTGSYYDEASVASSVRNTKNIQFLAHFCDQIHERNAKERRLSDHSDFGWIVPLKWWILQHPDALYRENVNPTHCIIVKLILKST